MPDLHSKVALITGASRGNGKFITGALAGAGARVVMAARRMARLTDAQADLALSAEQALLVSTDVRENDQVEALFKRAVAHFGRLDIVVCNAGILSIGTPLGEPLERVYRLLRTNLWGYMTCTRAALRTFRAQSQGGHLVVIDSLGGRRLTKQMPSYGVSKFAVRGFTESLRAEAARLGVRVTLIEPSPVATNIASELPNLLRRMIETPGHLLRPEDIGQAVLYAVTCPPTVNIDEIVIRHTGWKT
jgi:NADP-dependent 3-hydroxy acid dehydrogenase YdfG